MQYTAQRKALLGTESNSSLSSARVYDGIGALLNVTGGKVVYKVGRFICRPGSMNLLLDCLLNYTVCVRYWSSAEC